MKRLLIIAVAGSIAGPAAAEIGALECRALRDFFAIYERKAEIADAEVLEIMRTTPLAFETENSESGLHEAIVAAGYDPVQLVREQETVDDFLVVVESHCGN